MGGRVPSCAGVSALSEATARVSAEAEASSAGGGCGVIPAAILRGAGVLEIK